jgi:centromere/kinetochore protein ZW10
LTEPKCLISIGQLVETAVVQVTNDIVAIPDITADESERLKQICDVLRPVEEMFKSHVSLHACPGRERGIADIPSMSQGVNIVAYVPHWLRFCYVAEIMASPSHVHP